MKDKKKLHFKVKESCNLWATLHINHNVQFTQKSYELKSDKTLFRKMCSD